MNKLIIFLPLLLFADIIFPYTFSLKKDEIIKFNIYYDKFTYLFKMEWTLYKNKNLVVVYWFNNFPRQVMLKKEYPLDTFKVKIAKFPIFYPYLLIKFEDFKDNNATFKMYLFNPKDVKIEEQ